MGSPPTTPTLTATTVSISTPAFTTCRSSSFSTASAGARYPAVIDAHRVPASATSTSQSIAIVRSPSRFRSVTARSDRPIRRWISCVRPLGRPLLTSRAERSAVARGSIEYSAVTHPLPVPRIHLGASSRSEAATSTFVRPCEKSTDPSAHSWNPSSTSIGRSSSGARPSERGLMRFPLVAARSFADLVGGVLHGDVDRTVELLGGLRLGGLLVQRRPDVREHQPPDPGLARVDRGLPGRQMERHQVVPVLPGRLGEEQLGAAGEVLDVV